eukprot:scaffold7588_cov69-Phaeocystis_antarctica.AAC.6
MSSPSSTEKVLERLRKGGGGKFGVGGSSCVKPSLGRAARRWPRRAARPPTLAPGAAPLGAPRAARASPSPRARRRWWRRAARCGSAPGGQAVARQGGCKAAAPRLEPRVGSFASKRGGRQAAGQIAALSRSDAGAAGTNGHRRGVNQQQRTRAACLAAA